MESPPGGITSSAAHCPRRTAIAGAVIAGLLVLSACTGSPAEDEPAPGAATATTAPTPEASPSDAQRFASLEEAASGQYTSWEHAGDFTGTTDGIAQASREGTAAADIASGSAGTIDVTLPAPRDPALDMIVMSAACTGSDTYWIRVVQPNPNRVGGTCSEQSGAVLGVPLDDPTAPTRLEVTVPDGSRIWLSASYGRK